MNNTARINDVSDISIETIKKALIKQHQLEAANDQVVSPAASLEHVEAVKRWVAPCEFAIGKKAKVLGCAESGMLESVAVQLVDGQLFILANCVENEKQARDMFLYGSIGLIAVPRFLERFNDNAIGFLYSSLPEEQVEAMSLLYGADLDKSLMVKLYLASLVTLDVEPSFYEKRDSWQRMLLRKVLPKLKWQSHDFQYLVYRAKKAF